MSSKTQSPGQKKGLKKLGFVLFQTKFIQTQTSRFRGDLSLKGRTSLPSDGAAAAPATCDVYDKAGHVAGTAHRTALQTHWREAPKGLTEGNVMGPKCISFRGNSSILNNKPQGQRPQRLSHLGMWKPPSPSETEVTSVLTQSSPLPTPTLSGTLHSGVNPQRARHPQQNSPFTSDQSADHPVVLVSDTNAASSYPEGSRTKREKPTAQPT